MRIAASWSGGKDSCQAFYKALCQGAQVTHLFNTMSEDGERSMSHGLDSRLMVAQAEAIGIPIVQVRTSWDAYETDFKKAIGQLRRSGLEGMVFGDIDLQEHREWVERVCNELDIRPLLPLWGLERERVLADFVDSGFEAVVVTVRADILGEEWLGRRIGTEFVEDLSGSKPEVDLCGEAGEFHTFVVNGPPFKQRIEIRESRKVSRGEYRFLDITRFELI